MDWVLLVLVLLLLLVLLVVLVGFSSTSSLAFASLAPWRETLCWRSLVAPEFLSLTQRRKARQGRWGGGARDGLMVVE